MNADQEIDLQAAEQIAETAYFLALELLETTEDVNAYVEQAVGV